MRETVIERLLELCEEINYDAAGLMSEAGVVYEESLEDDESMFSCLEDEDLIKIFECAAKLAAL